MVKIDIDNLGTRACDPIGVGLIVSVEQHISCANVKNSLITRFPITAPRNDRDIRRPMLMARRIKIWIKAIAGVMKLWHGHLLSLWVNEDKKRPDKSS
jgi:hypothetical protein